MPRLLSNVFARGQDWLIAAPFRISFLFPYCLLGTLFPTAVK